MKINWTAFAALAPLFVSLFVWAVSIEVRMSQHSNIQQIETEISQLKSDQHEHSKSLSTDINGFTSEVRGLTRRIQNLEEVLVPVLVDYKVRKELEKAAPPAPVAPPSPPKFVPNIAGTPNPSQKPIEDEAYKWAQNEIQRGQKPKASKTQ